LEKKKKKKKKMLNAHNSFGSADSLLGVAVRLTVHQSSDNSKYRVRASLGATAEAAAASTATTQFSGVLNSTVLVSNVYSIGCASCLWNVTAPTLAANLSTGVFVRIELTPLHDTFEAIAIKCLTLVAHTSSPDTTTATIADTTTTSDSTTTAADNSTTTTTTTTTITTIATTTAVSGASSTAPTVAPTPAISCQGVLATLSFSRINVGALLGAMGLAANASLPIQACGQLIRIEPLAGRLSNLPARGLGVANGSSSGDLELAGARKLQFKLSLDQLLWNVVFDNFKIKTDKAELVVGNVKAVSESSEWLYIEAMVSNVTLPAAREMVIGAVDASSFTVLSVAFRTEELRTTAPPLTSPPPPVAPVCTGNDVECFMVEQELFFWLIIALGSCCICVVFFGVLTYCYLQRKKRTSEDYSMRDADHLDYYN
jgi:hypothetical protein